VTGLTQMGRGKRGRDRPMRKAREASRDEYVTSLTQMESSSVLLSMDALLNPRHQDIC
jgi:hypothetical protein